MLLNTLKPFVLGLIIAGGVLVLLLLALMIFLLIKRAKKQKAYKEEQKIIDSYYVNIIEDVGGIDNITKVEYVGSRLSFYLKNQSLLRVEKLKEIHIEGIVKTSKKVTLVVGEMAAKYAASIQKEIGNEEK